MINIAYRLQREEIRKRDERLIMKFSLFFFPALIALWAVIHFWVLGLGLLIAGI